MIKSPWLRLSVGAFLLLVAMGLGVAIAIVVASEDRPVGVVGPDADARATRMIEAVDGEAWRATGAVRWTMLGHTHLWDRERNLARVAFSGKEVWIDLHAKHGVAVQNGERLDGAAREKALEKAYAWWVNDSFWLNPVVKAFDEGTTRATVGDNGLLVAYSSGGLTPGDAYLWWLDEQGRPERWQLWVSVIPIGGATIGWEGWTQLSTGAWVATRHPAGPGAFELTDVAGAATLAELEPGDDPFAVLFE